MQKYKIEYELTRNGDPKVFHNKKEGEDVFVIICNSEKNGDVKIESYEYYQSDITSLQLMTKFSIIMHYMANSISDPHMPEIIREIFSKTVEELNNIAESESKNISKH